MTHPDCRSVIMASEPAPAKVRARAIAVNS
jgi:hypothetical protein